MPGERPLFTVIISTFNRRHIITRAIDSVLKQTFRGFELLIIDNGSTDGTQAVVEGIKDPRLRYIRNPNPSGSCDGPRNMGIEAAEGSLVAFLDDDDIWYPERLEKVKKAFEKNPQADAVCHYENYTSDGKNKRVIKYGPVEGGLYERLIYENNCLSSCGTTVKAEALKEMGGFDLRKEFAAGADYDLWIRMAAKGMKFRIIEEPLGEFTFTGKNWSVADPAFQSRLAFLVRYHIQRYENKKLSGISKRGMKRLLRLYCIAGASLLRAGRVFDALKCFLTACIFILRRPGLLPGLISEILERINEKQSR